MIFKNIFIKNITYEVIKQSLLMILSIVIIFLFIIHIWFLIGALSSRKVIVESDFIHSYSAANIIRDGGDLYDIENQLKYQNQALYPDKKEFAHPFRNPPFVALLFYPFSKLSYFEAFYVFNLFNLILIFIVLIITLRYFGNLGKFRLSFLLPFAFSPVILCLVKGQTTILMLLIYLITLKYYKINPKVSGFVYSLSVIKPHFFAVGLPFVLLSTVNKKSYLLGLSLGIVVLVLISVGVSGVLSILKYPLYLVTTENQQHGTLFADMFNLRIFFQNIVHEELQIYILVAIMYLLTILIFAMRQKYLESNEALSIAFLLIPILSPHTFPYDLTIWLIPIMMLINNSYANTKNYFVGLLAATFVLAIPNLKFLGIYWLNSIPVLAIVFYLLLARKGKNVKTF